LLGEFKVPQRVRGGSPDHVAVLCKDATSSLLFLVPRWFTDKIFRLCDFTMEIKNRNFFINIF